MSTQLTSNAASKITQCEQLINYTFDEKLLCLQALQASGEAVHYAGTWHILAKNDALAVLGDAYMAAVLCRWWWEKGPRNKGQLDNKALAARSRLLSLDKCLFVNQGTKPDANGNYVTDKVAATGMEAVAGAVYLDGGESQLEEVMRHLGFDQHPFL
ncbi:hypothetical protein K491DRAFT_684545 [Lophiostoma macrostomum CBS 122681]|uniref:RNase III domain-containing protein n=1 Tax=Lophiostoma macrostomum CBS 122681 TaxID=1314788 RepID=A0A6A6SNU6_9PLEO|nr:hypothetical protein K491DRAFT_684545 [Lophiostoma macrostomum CBS 122681]